MPLSFQARALLDKSTAERALFSAMNTREAFTSIRKRKGRCVPRRTAWASSVYCTSCVHSTCMCRYIHTHTRTYMHTCIMHADIQTYRHTDREAGRQTGWQTDRETYSYIACMHTYTYTHKHTGTQTHIHTYTYTPIHPYTYTHIYTYTHTRMHTYTHTGMYTYSHTAMRTYTRIYTRICTYRHIDMHTHTHSLTHACIHK